MRSAVGLHTSHLTPEMKRLRKPTSLGWFELTVNNPGTLWTAKYGEHHERSEKATASMVEALFGGWTMMPHQIRSQHQELKVLDVEVDGDLDS